MEVVLEVNVTRNPVRFLVEGLVTGERRSVSMVRPLSFLELLLLQVQHVTRRQQGKMFLPCDRGIEVLIRVLMHR